MKLEIEYLPIERLEPYENNARKHEEYDVEQIKKSIEKYGFNDPIGIWSDHNVIVEGHGRLMAAKKLGMTEVPVIRLDHMTDEERREYAIMHNKTAELSDWDFDLLGSELEALDLSDFDIDFGLPDLGLDNNEVVDDDYDPEPPEEPTAKHGEIWVLGAHRVMCGDATSEEDVGKLMGGGTGRPVSDGSAVQRGTRSNKRSSVTSERSETVTPENRRSDHTK